jgi:major membrane immunogen (membrane-anchored lipoprotein)
MIKPSLVAIAIPLVLLTCLVACSKTLPAGTYVEQKEPKNYLELKADGTFLLQKDGGSYAGKYNQDGENIDMKADAGFSSRVTIRGGTLTDTDGYLWVKR